MPTLTMSLACGLYDRTDAMRLGTVRPEGIELLYVPIQSPAEIFERLIHGSQFDAAEMSLSLYLQLRGKEHFRYVALPIFPSRMFRHGSIVVNKDLVREPKELEGCDVGVPVCWMTAAVWIRGVLQHEYGVDLNRIRWWEGGVKAPLTVAEMQRRRSDPGPRPPFIPADQSLVTMLEKGDLGALVGVSRSIFEPSVNRLFQDYRREERDYFERTRIFPIMHVVVIREDLYNRHPWIAESLFKAFVEAKSLALHKMANTDSNAYMMPWLHATIEEACQVMGEDFWPYGLGPNLHVLETFVAYLIEQGFLADAFDMSDAFVPIIEVSQ